MIVVDKSIHFFVGRLRAKVDQKIQALRTQTYTTQTISRGSMEMRLALFPHGNQRPNRTCEALGRYLILQGSRHFLRVALDQQQCLENLCVSFAFVVAILNIRPELEANIEDAFYLPIQKLVVAGSAQSPRCSISPCPDDSYMKKTGSF
jgi:hypothetical protein